MSINQDLLPIHRDDRTWNYQDIASVWIGTVICVPSYCLGALLVIQFNFSIGQVILALLTSGTIAVSLSLLCAEPGWRYGIATPILLKKVFGYKGTVLPTMIRCLTNCGWLGIQTLFGGTALHLIFSTFFPSWSVLNGTGEVICYGLFLLSNLIICWYGNEMVRRFEVWSAPLLIATGIGLLIWAVKTLDWPSFKIQEKMRGVASFSLWFQGMIFVLGSWMSMALFMSDFSRFVHYRRDYQIGQLLGLLPGKLIFGTLGAFLGAASGLLIGQETFDMTVLAGGLESPILRVIALLMILLATLTTNITGNLVIPVNDILSLSGHIINYRKGIIMVACIGSCLALPELLRRAGLEWTTDFVSLFTHFLVTYASVLSGIIAILIVDYYFVCQQKLSLVNLYNKMEHSWHWRSCTVFFLIVFEVLAVNTIEHLKFLRPYGSVINLIAGGILYRGMVMIKKVQPSYHIN